MDLIEQVRRTIYREDLLRRGEAVVIGVSGGVDSMVLLEILKRIGDWRLHVAHFNHSLRGAESEGDEIFVRGAAQTRGFPFHSERGNVKAHAAAQRVSIEMAARDLRYKFLESAAERVGAIRIVMAHHADDQVETFWLRLLRGDAGPGLAGMRWKRPAGGNGELQIVRPLLEVWKSELVSFAEQNGIAFREDSSNASHDFQRNRLRGEILPLLAKFQPALAEISWRAADVLAAEKAFVQASAEEFLIGKSEQFSGLQKAVQREVIRMQLISQSVKPSYELIENLRCATDLPVSIAPEQVALRAATGVVRVQHKGSLEFSEQAKPVALGETGREVVGICEIQWAIVQERGTPVAGTEYFDAEAIGAKGVVRFWQAGDRFQPIGLNAPVKLQDLLTNAKISSTERRRLLVAEDADGRIFWVEGLRMSELHKVTSKSRKVLRWSWRRASENSPVSADGG